MTTDIACQNCNGSGKSQKQFSDGSHYECVKCGGTGKDPSKFLIWGRLQKCSTCGTLLKIEDYWGPNRLCPSCQKGK